MADISQITVGSTTYNIKDTTARSDASSASSAASSASTAAASAQTAASSALAAASSAQTAATSALALASQANTNASSAMTASASAYAHGDDAIAASSAVASALTSHMNTVNAHGVTLGGLIGVPSYLTPSTHTYSTAISGGYVQLGPLIIVNMSITVASITAGARNVARYLPGAITATALAITGRASSDPQVTARLTTAGIIQLITNTAITAGTIYDVGGIYLTDSTAADASPQIIQDPNNGDLTVS